MNVYVFQAKSIDFLLYLNTLSQTVTTGQNPIDNSIALTSNTVVGEGRDVFDIVASFIQAPTPQGKYFTFEYSELPNTEKIEVIDKERKNIALAIEKDAPSRSPRPDPSPRPVNENLANKSFEPPAIQGKHAILN